MQIQIHSAVYRAQCEVYSTVYNVQCVHCTVCIVYSMYSVQCIVYSVKCTAQFTVYSATVQQCTVALYNSVQCNCTTVYSATVQGLVWLFALSNVCWAVGRSQLLTEKRGSSGDTSILVSPSSHLSALEILYWTSILVSPSSQIIWKHWLDTLSYLKTLVFWFSDSSHIIPGILQHINLPIWIDNCFDLTVSLHCKIKVFCIRSVWKHWPHGRQ